MISGPSEFITISAVEITERVEAAEQIQILLKEVNHRAKNILSLVQSIARHTVQRDNRDFLREFLERIQALSRGHDLVIATEWKPVDLRNLVGSQLAHFKSIIGRRIRLDGPDVEVSAAQAQTLGLAFHELATNASKYGALSNDTGTVDVTWSLGDGEHPPLAICWKESGGPAAVAPVRRGFGSVVTRELVESALQARVRVDYTEDWLTWSLETRDGATVLPETGAARAARVLVVEDEALLAMDLADTLDTAGFEVVGPVGDVDDALALIETDSIDFAILDINLGPRTSEAIAQRLKTSGTPFIALSG